MRFPHRRLFAIAPLAVFGAGIVVSAVHAAKPARSCHPVKWCSPTTTVAPTTTTVAPTTTTVAPTTTTVAPTTTEPPPPPGFSSSQLVFNDSFGGSSLDASKWNTFMTSKAANGWPWFGNNEGGSALSGSGGTNLDYDMPTQVSVNGGLSLLGQAFSSSSGYPWTSGVITTYNHFEFDGGYVQIRAKVPTADGDWPAFWMLPGPGANTTTDNFEIDLFEGGMTGAGPAVDNFSYHVHMNDSTQWGGTVDTGVDLGAGYHTYGLDWVPGQSITWYLDGNEVAKVTSAQFTIPNEPMELIIDNAVASSATSGWHTVTDATTGTSSALLVSSVQVYA